MAVILPTVHLNGTSRDQLQEQLAAAINALDGAITALSNATPNARDYYQQGPDAFKAAAANHIARIQAVQAVWNELLDTYSALDQ